MSLDQYPSSRPPILDPIIEALRRHALLRSVTYGVGMNVIGFVASHVLNPSGAQEWSMPYVLAVHTLAMPFMGAFTYAFIRLREEDTDWWAEVLGKKVVRYLCIGVTLGSAVYLAQTGIALMLGWVSFPSPGWRRSSEIAIVRTLVSHLANLCVALNEEMIYRGYGLYSLSGAISLPGAITLLVPLFAWTHGGGWQTFVGQCTLGLSTTALKLVSNSLWLPVGYHAAWNYVQTAIIGPPDASPSLLPMHVEGPKLWMGRPGYPEPGLLSTLTNLAVAVVAFFLWWRLRSKTAGQHA